jgi:prepilin-type N-terminal cleavage/methylation domain-containing protein
MTPIGPYALVKGRRGGFSLLELSVVLVIIAVITGTGMVVGKATLESAQIATTNSRINTIETAILAYRRANDRLPCPGDASMTSSNALFGYEAANSGVCTGGSPSANYTFTTSGSEVVEGAVPVRTLSLPDEFMYDGWGRKFAYGVWVGLTAPLGFNNYGITPNCGLITIRNAGGATRTTKANYALVSFGSNGHGGFNERGARVNAGSVNTDEQLNCHCDGSGVNTGYLGLYVTKDITESATNTLDNFDDIVRYKERWQLQSYFDEYNPGGYNMCPSGGPGNRADGDAADDNSGWSHAFGDVNGDGITDLAVGVPRISAGGNAGSVYVVFGTAIGLTNPFLLSGLDGTNGFVLNSTEADDHAGYDVEMGDVNADGVQDIIIGAPQANGGAGKVYVVFGHTGTWAAAISLATLAGNDGLVINGENAGDHAGFSVGTGDANRDRAMDIVIGAPDYDAGGNTDSGGVYVVLGHFTVWPASINLASLSGQGFLLEGVDDNDRMGFAVHSADVNGDAIDDLLMGAPSAGATPGTAYALFGKKKGWKDQKMKAVTASTGFKMLGAANGDGLGSSISAADVNGNGVNDILVGAPGQNASTGAAYVIFGQRAKKLKTLEVSNLNGTNGFRITGVSAGNITATAIVGGDINGDGYADVVLGAPGAAPGGRVQAGSTYFVFGAATGWPSSLNLAALNGTNGFILDGTTAGDQSGFSLAVGDLNGDFRTDTGIGAPYAGYTASQAGAVYTFFGQRRSGAWPLNTNLNTL